MSTSPFAGLKPELLWKHFEAFTKTPRPSGREQEIAAHVESWAEGLGYEVVKDATGNLCVRVPGRPGRENADPVVVQGHLDMVCERNADSPHDAETGPVHVVREGDWLTAEGTTLGADNAIGVCAGMAAAEDPDVVRGPLELLMTLDEETGMTGAMTLDASLVRGRTMLNLDSEDDGVLFVGCAGGCDTRIELELDREDGPAAGHEVLEVSVKGLKGGHSGLDINNNRMNAIHALARVLDAMRGAGELRVVSIDGGSKRNAIPREAGAVVTMPSSEGPAARQAADAARDALLEHYAGLDDGLQVTISSATAKPTQVATKDATHRAIALLRAIPSGVIAMSQDIEGLVETSSNLGVVTTEGDTMRVVCCSRSSVKPAIDGVLDQIASICALAGAKAVRHGEYPGWKPNMNSRVLGITRDASERLFGQAPEITAIHAGLECGLLGERVPEMDMVSFGPDIRGAHSPDERVHAPSVERFWKLLAAVLDDLSK